MRSSARACQRHPTSSASTKRKVGGWRSAFSGYRTVAQKDGVAASTAWDAFSWRLDWGGWARGVRLGPGACRTSELVCAARACANVCVSTGLPKAPPRHGRRHSRDGHVRRAVSKNGKNTPERHLMPRAHDGRSCGIIRADQGSSGPHCAHTMRENLLAAFPLDHGRMRTLLLAREFSRLMQWDGNSVDDVNLHFRQIGETEEGRFQPL